MKLRLFQYTVLLHPVKDDEKTKTTFLVEPTMKLAKDERALSMTIAKEIPEEYMDRLEDVEILIRPF
jgi:hypothetical protein